jgi:radical SAM superfamily enzyme YgiQ (UPF0313 family)
VRVELWFSGDKTVALGAYTQIMRVLCIYPSFPKTYWGSEYSLDLTGRKSILPPLGLLTVAALLPREWEIELADLNITPLDPARLEWADVVFLSGMLIQRQSMLAVARAARARGKPVVVGGAYASTSPDAIAPEVDCVVVGEAEGLIATLVDAITRGELPARLEADEYPDVTTVPPPRFDLIDISAYQSIGVQWSRGCPFNCEFCDIIEIFGRRPRTKTVPQLLAELDAIYATGFRGSIFLVDDNFIGNKVEARRLLGPLGEWTRAHNHGFFYYTEASLNLASDDGLIDSMVAAGFSAVFIGIETPAPEALRHTQKLQNTTIDAAEAVRKLTARGLEVMAGFIVGFDTDDAGAVERQREWIAAAPIPLAMVGILIALPGTQLARRLEREGRLLYESGGDNFVRTNFITKLDEVELLAGYRKLLAQIYSPEAFFARALQSLELCPVDPCPFRYALRYQVECLARSFWLQGVRWRHRGAYWRFLGRALVRTPRRFPRAIGLAINAAHMIRYTEDHVLPELDRGMDEARRHPRPALRASALRLPVAAADATAATAADATAATAEERATANAR